MHCRTCNNLLPAGAKSCPNCGTPVPAADQTVIDSRSQESQVPPTVYGGPVPPAPPSNPYSQPSSPYNQSSGANYDPTPQPSSPYNQSGANYQQSNPYQQQPYNPSGPGYPPPANNQQGGVPPFPPAGPGAFGPPPIQPPRKSNTGKIVGITCGVLALLCIISSAIGFFVINNAANQVASTLSPELTKVALTSTAIANKGDSTPTTDDVTPTPTKEVVDTSKSPSGNSVDAEALKRIPKVALATKVNSDTQAPIPGTETTTFKANETIYFTFTLDVDDMDFSAEKAYISAEFYLGKNALEGGKPLVLDQPAPGGAFTAVYYKATTLGAAEIYWCKQADCSDRKLAHVAYFTVTN